MDADFASVWELHRLAIEPIGVFLKNGSWDDDLRDITNHYLKNRGEFLVGLLNNRIVCMGAFRKKSETLAEIKRMRVLPDYQRRGFGQTIMNQLELKALQSGYSELILDTRTKQIAAQQFYKKNGFVESGRGKFEGFELIFYRKKLK
jgi:ribosomal protein S18 acetylase RimI-like enzyme